MLSVVSEPAVEEATGSTERNVLFFPKEPPSDLKIRARECFGGAGSIWESPKRTTGFYSGIKWDINPGAAWSVIAVIALDADWQTLFGLWMEIQETNKRIGSSMELYSISSLGCTQFELIDNSVLCDFLMIQE
ncbi:MAG: hypothetical protein NTV02_00510 [Candidatus Zambryskibacteria bacterium]|nr:hypothetical protein [Candidatus Zambryskibacteria bacterium]